MRQKHMIDEQERLLIIFHCAKVLWYERLQIRKAPSRAQNDALEATRSHSAPQVHIERFKAQSEEILMCSL